MLNPNASHPVPDQATTKEASSLRIGLHRYGSRFAVSWRRGHREAREDMRRNWVVFLIILIWFGGLVSCIILLSYVVPGLSRNGTACHPDGSFSVDENYEYWSSSGLFQITMGIGALSFTQAKVIDVAWDIVFGRGGQSVVAFISWRVFARYLTTSMEHTSITLDTYRTIFLQSDSLILSIFRMIRDFATRLRLHSMVAMCFIIATLLYILAFPTLGSAMTGYSANVGSYVPDRDGNYIPFASWDLTAYIINDGWRVNRSGSFHVSHVKRVDPLQDVVGIISGDECRGYVSAKGGKNYSESLDNCHMLANVSSYSGDYGFYGLADEPSTFMGFTLDPPVLNITPIYLGDQLWSSTPWGNSGLYKGSLSNQSNMVWTWSNQTFDRNYVTTNGRCQANETYQWGFAYVQLNIMIFLTLAWSFGMMIMYLESRCAIRREGGRDVAGSHKAVFELAYATHQQLLLLGNDQADAMATSSKDDDIKRRSAALASSMADENRKEEITPPPGSLLIVSALSESEIHRRISKDLRGGSISYRRYSPSLRDNLNPAEYIDEKLRIKKQRLRGWFHKEGGWLSVLVLSLGISAGSICGIMFGNSLRSQVALALYPILTLGCGLSFAALFAFFTGSTHYSRITLFLYSYILVAVVPAMSVGILFAAVA